MLVGGRTPAAAPPRKTTTAKSAGGPLYAREASRALVPDEPLSFWGGVDPATGAVIDVHHPQVPGPSVAGRVLVMPAGRGVQLQLLRAGRIRARSGTARLAIVLGEPDAIIALGALVATELYGTSLPRWWLRPARRSPPATW